MKSNYIKTAVCGAMVILLAAACQKENKKPPFNAIGYWKGTAYLYTTAILNKSDGTSRLYVRTVSNDTARADIKLNGTFTSNEDGMKAIYYYSDSTDNIMLETYTASQTNITGLLALTTGEAVTFDLRKQPSK